MNQSTILLVEDNRALRLVYRTQLERDGFMVLEAETTKAALDHLQLSPVNLMILDILLPDKNGLVFLGELRTDVRFNKLPVLLLTTLSDEIVFKKGQELGVYGSLYKDKATPEELSQRVTHALDEVQQTSSSVTH